MSIIDQLMQEKSAGGLFGVVAGCRLSGKSTLGGTFPGKTLMVQASVLETGSESARTLAQRSGNELDIIEFRSIKELVSVLDEVGSTDYDNVYIDGISAINEIKAHEPEMVKLQRKNVWDHFREIGANAQLVLLKAKQVAKQSNKNIFFTLAMKEKFDDFGNLSSLAPDCKGNMTLGEIKRLCPTVVVVRTAAGEDGKLARQLVTKVDGPYSARIDTLLDEDNPGILPANMGDVFNLVRGE